MACSFFFVSFFVFVCLFCCFVCLFVFFISRTGWDSASGRCGCGRRRRRRRRRRALRRRGRRWPAGLGPAAAARGGRRVRAAPERSAGRSRRRAPTRAPAPSRPAARPAARSGTDAPAAAAPETRSRSCSQKKKHRSRRHALIERENPQQPSLPFHDIDLARTPSNHHQGMNGVSSRMTPTSNKTGTRKCIMTSGLINQSRMTGETVRKLVARWPSPTHHSGSCVFQLAADNCSTTVFRFQSNTLDSIQTQFARPPNVKTFSLVRVILFDSTSSSFKRKKKSALPISIWNYANQSNQRSSGEYWLVCAGFPRRPASRLEDALGKRDARVVRRRYAGRRWWRGRVLILQSTAPMQWRHTRVINRFLLATSFSDRETKNKRFRWAPFPRPLSLSLSLLVYISSFVFGGSSSVLTCFQWDCRFFPATWTARISEMENICTQISFEDGPESWIKDSKIDPRSVLVDVDFEVVRNVHGGVHWWLRFAKDEALTQTQRPIDSLGEKINDSLHVSAGGHNMASGKNEEIIWLFFYLRGVSSPGWKQSGVADWLIIGRQFGSLYSFCDCLDCAQVCTIQCERNNKSWTDFDLKQVIVESNQECKDKRSAMGCLGRDTVVPLPWLTWFNTLWNQRITK